MIPIRDENPTARRAVVTVLLIIVNLAVYFAIQLPKSPDAETRFDYRWAGVPCEIHTGKPVVAVPETTPVPAGACAVQATNLSTPIRPFPDKNVWLAVILSMFLHGSVLHVLGNMLFLWIFGNNVEDQLGRVLFFAFYMIGGIVASGVHIIGNLHSAVPFLGASGAIAAVMGAYIVWFPRARVLTIFIFFFFWPLRLPAFYVLGLWFILQLFTSSSSGIATLAHVGGFAFGALVALALRGIGFPRPRVPYNPGYY